MTHVLTTELFQTVVAGYRDQLIRYEFLLNDLDNRIGDGDHGTNMVRGFHVAVDKLGSASAGDLSSLANTAAMALLGSVGGASGPLYGTVFMKFSSTWKGFHAISSEQLTDAVVTAAQGIAARGKAAVGDKTMLDVWMPVAEALGGEGNFDEQALAAITIARQRALESKGRMARMGRAAYLGERSVGTCDPGCISSAMFLEELFSAVTGGVDRHEWETSVL